MPGPRNPVGATRFALELDGAAAGQPVSAAGGDAIADVVVEPAGPDRIRRKHLGPVHYTDIALTCGIGMEKGFWTWLSDTLAGNGAARDGALSILDFDGKERERLAFTGALVTEISLPALDGASRDPVRLGVRISAEDVRHEAGSGASHKAGVKPKQALASNFSVELADLDLKRVARVGPLTVRQEVAEESLGALAHPVRTPVSLDVSDLELTLSETGSKSVADWHRRFVVEGNSSDQDEKSGSIALLDPTLKTTLLRLDLAGVGIFALERVQAEAGGETASRLRARMYCEELRLVVPGKPG
jgi:hypothetical protein